jgi:hypothetical protein
MALMALRSNTMLSAFFQDFLVKSGTGTTANCPEMHSTQQRNALAPPLTLLCCFMKFAMSAMTTP